MISYNNIPSQLIGRSVSICPCICQSCILCNSSCPTRTCHCFRVWSKALALGFIQTLILQVVFLQTTNRNYLRHPCRFIWLTGRVRRKNHTQHWNWWMKKSTKDASISSRAPSMTLRSIFLMWRLADWALLSLTLDLQGWWWIAVYVESMTDANYQNVQHCHQLKMLFVVSPYETIHGNCLVFHWISRVLTKEWSWKKVSKDF